MASIDVAKLLNKITQDIPGINTVLKALAKWDVSALTDVPDGAMQATTDANNRLTIKKKVSGSYTPVAKLMHDVDTLDGYHASTSATANTIAVRNASGVLPGNITGNAATANTATALAAGTVVPVNQGGTGATTASQARTNLGVADGADFTTHIAKQASPSVEGHVKLDKLAADGSNTAAPGGFGLGRSLVSSVDANLCVANGWYFFNTATANLPPTSAFYAVFVRGVDTNNCIQYAHTLSGTYEYKRVLSAGVWGNWAPQPLGITDSTSTTSSTIAASATAVSSVRDEVVSARSIANSAVTAADYAQTKSGTSSTASSTAAKVVTCSGFTLSTNARVFVTFSNANTVAGALTLNVNGTGAKSVYNQTGIISASNTALFAANQPIEFRYDGTGWVFVDVAKAFTDTNSAITGAARNLKGSATGTSTSVSYTMDEVVVKNNSNQYLTLRSLSLTWNAAGSGVANGIDTGSIAANTWYYVHVIHNPTTSTTDMLISLSSTAPTLPSGYTYFARVGAIRWGTSYPLSFTQSGRWVRPKVASGSNVTALPSAIKGVQGSLTTPTWVSASLSSIVPGTAVAVHVVIPAVGGGGAVAPNNSYGGGASTTNPPPIAAMVAGAGASGIIPLETMNIYYAADNANRGAFIAGWEDNL